jgi:hypothetical protein
MLQLKSKKDVLRIVKDRDVSFIQIWFTDILGTLKSFAMTPSELEGALTEGMGFDGSSIEGFARIEESDMIAMPDPATFQFLPWRPQERPVARMFCDILQPDGSHYAGDPRYVLKRALQKVADKGYKFYIGPEKTAKPRISLIKGAILIHGRWIWPATCAETPSLCSRIWEFRWSTATTRSPPASMKLICALTRV